MRLTNPGGTACGKAIRAYLRQLRQLRLITLTLSWRAGLSGVDAAGSRATPRHRSVAVAGAGLPVDDRRAGRDEVADGLALEGGVEHPAHRIDHPGLHRLADRVPAVVRVRRDRGDGELRGERDHRL